MPEEPRESPGARSRSEEVMRYVQEYLQLLDEGQAVSVDSTLGLIECPFYLRLEVATPLQHEEAHDASTRHSEHREAPCNDANLREETLTRPAPHHEGANQ